MNSTQTFDRLFRDAQPKIVQYVAKQVRDQDAAEDIAQDTMLKLLEAIAKGTEVKAPLGLAYAIARFQILAYRKRLARHPDLSLDAPATSESAEGVDGLELPDSRMDPLTMFVKAHDDQEHATHLRRRLGAVKRKKTQATNRAKHATTCARERAKKDAELRAAVMVEIEATFPDPNQRRELVTAPFLESLFQTKRLQAITAEIYY